MKAAEQIGRELAYPLTEHNADGSYYADHSGMTKRQYYKAAAMQGSCAGIGSGWTADQLANWCGAVADAMLAEDAEFEAKEAKAKRAAQDPIW
jgi:hypothetical protein